MVKSTMTETCSAVLRSRRHRQCYIGLRVKPQCQCDSDYCFNCLSLFVQSFERYDMSWRFFDCTADSVGQLNGNGQKGMLQIDASTPCRWLRHRTLPRQSSARSGNDYALLAVCGKRRHKTVRCLSVCLSRRSTAAAAAGGPAGLLLSAGAGSG